VCGIDDLSRGKLDKDFRDLDIEFIKVNLTRPSRLDLSSFDYIFHCAAVCGTKNFYDKPYFTLCNNIISTINLITLADNFKGKIIFTSTSENYSGNKDLPIPTPEVKNLSIADIYNPRWSYAGSKIVGEQLFIHSGKKYSIARLHNIYGERMGFGHVIPMVMQRIKEQQAPFEIIGKDDTRSFTYINDAVEALWEIAKSNNTDGKIINIGRKKETSIGDLYNDIFKITKFKPKKIIYKDSPDGSTKRRLPDVSLLRELTGYECQTKLKDGLKKTWDWYKHADIR